MKTVKEAHEKQRAVHMNMCMADFISPEHRFRSRHLNPPRRADSPSRRRSAPSQLVTQEPVTPPFSRTVSAQEQDALPPASPREDSVPALEFDIVDQANNSNSETSETPRLTVPGEETRGRTESRFLRSPAPSARPPTKIRTEADHQGIFDRAAYLLRQALDLAESGGGGVVLLDTNANADVSVDDPVEQFPDNEAGQNGFPSQVSSKLDVPVGHIGTPVRSDVAYSGSMRERVVLAAASINQAKGGAPKNHGRANSSFQVNLTPPELSRMCKKHPR